MGTFLEKLGRVCEALDYALTLTDIVSSVSLDCNGRNPGRSDTMFEKVHPAVESAASVASSLLEVWIKSLETVTC